MTLISGLGFAFDIFGIFDFDIFNFDDICYGVFSFGVFSFGISGFGISGYCDSGFGSLSAFIKSSLDFFSKPLIFLTCAINFNS